MKKICFVTTVSATLKAFVIDTAIYLHEKGGYDITFICDKDENLNTILPSYIKYIPISMKRGLRISGIFSFINLLRILKRERFDMIQYSTPNASFYASIASKIVNTPIRLYCQWGICYVGFTGIKRKCFKNIEKIICCFSTWIEPDSFGNRCFSIKEGLYKKTKSSVIWNGSASGVNLKKFDIAYKNKWRNDIRDKYKLKSDTVVLGYVGRITRDKGINELLQAYKTYLVANLNSVLMLVGNIEYNANLDCKLYQWSKEEKRVIYCGHNDNIEKFVAAMDVFILPSYREGFGTSVIESQAMGVPVIVSNIPGPTEAMILNKTGLIFEKKNSLDLLMNINKILFDIKLLNNMSISAVDFVKNRFNQDILVQKILEDRNRLFNENK